VKTINRKLVIDLYKSASKKYKVKFRCINDSFFYKILIKRGLRRIGLNTKQIDSFLSTRSITAPWGIFMPFKYGSSKYPYISQIHKLSHELQHWIDKSHDKKWYKKYTKDEIFRGLQEGRGSSSEIEIKWLMDNKYVPRGMNDSTLKKVYMLSEVGRSIYRKTIKGTIKSSNNSPSFEASKFVWSFIIRFLNHTEGRHC
jgi:hypothetical protein